MIINGINIIFMFSKGSFLTNLIPISEKMIIENPTKKTKSLKLEYFIFSFDLRIIKSTINIRLGK